MEKIKRRRYIVKYISSLHRSDISDCIHEQSVGFFDLSSVVTNAIATVVEIICATMGCASNELIGAKNEFEIVNVINYKLKFRKPILNAENVFIY